MSLQGSVHTWSDGIGYGAFLPTDRAYYNVRTPRASGRRPSSEQLREYRRNNVTGGIDTHRSDISFGKTTESVRGGREGDLRARQATKSLTSGEVGGFVWPAERARDGDVETILASSSAAASNASVAVSSLASGGRGSEHGALPMMLSPHSVNQHERAAEAQVLSARERQGRPPRQEQEQEQQLRGGGLSKLSARSRASTSSNRGGGSTQRSDSTCAPSSRSSSRSSTGSYTSSRLSSFRSAASSSSEHRNTDRRSNSGRSSRSSASRSRSRAPRPTSYDATNQGAALVTAGHHLSHRSNNGSARENRLRPPTLRSHGTPPPSSSLAPSATKLPRVHALDPVFDRHHKYDLIAQERAAQGGEVTGRFGEVHGSSVLAASQLTSELSTPWSHVLRGQKW